MKQAWVLGVVVGALAVCPAIGLAAEHGGQEHGGTATAPAAKEHGGATQEHGGLPAATGAAQAGQIAQVEVEPSAEQLRQAIRDYVAKTEQANGAFTIQDPITDSTRTLTLARVHERVGKTGVLYYSCTDMNDVSTGEVLDLDFDVEAHPGGQLIVVDVRIHKVNGQPRYTYDDKDNRIPVM